MNQSRFLTFTNICLCVRKLLEAVMVRGGKPAANPGIPRSLWISGLDATARKSTCFNINFVIQSYGTTCCKEIRVNLVPHRILRALFPVTALTIVLVAIEVCVQQNYRMSANDPQIQMAQDAATGIADARQAIATQRVRYPRVDISKSLTPWLAVYDRHGALLAASATLDGAGPVPPSGVFQNAMTVPDDRLTWQPRVGVRAAIDVRPIAGGGFVVAGRSLREVEHREGDLLRILLGAWLAAVGVSIAWALVQRPPFAPVL